jgi:hypothetical protein
MTLSFPKLHFTLSAWLSNSYECFNQNNRLVIETEGVLYLSHISERLSYFTANLGGGGKQRGRRKFLKTLLKAVNGGGKYIPYHTSLGMQDEGRNGTEVMHFRQSRHTYKLVSCHREIWGSHAGWAGCDTVRSVRNLSTVRTDVPPHLPPKCWYSFIRLHGITSQNTRELNFVFIPTDTRKP